MKTVGKGELKAKMLEYFRVVEETGETLIVTDRGREVLEVKPIQKPPPRTLEDFYESLEAYQTGNGYEVKCSEEELFSSDEDWEPSDEEYIED